LSEAPSIEVGSSRTEFRPERGSRVLVVEDDAPLAQLLCQQLQAKSYNVSVVHDGEMAGQAIEGGELDLVILDLNLPRLDGLSALQQIRPSQPPLPVLVLMECQARWTAWCRKPTRHLSVCRHPIHHGDVFHGSKCSVGQYHGNSNSLCTGECAGERDVSIARRRPIGLSARTNR
jgi:hypothetical protein